MTGEEQKRIEEAFPGLNLPERLRDPSGAIRVAKVSLDRARRTLHVLLVGHQYLAKEDVYLLEIEIKRQIFPKVKLKVQIDERYTLSEQYTAENLFADYRGSILEELRRQGSMLAAAFHSAKVCFPSPMEMTLTLPDSIVARQRGDELADHLERLFRGRFGMSVPITLRFEDDKGAQLPPETFVRRRETPVKPETKPEAPAGKRRAAKRAGKESADPDLLYRKTFTEEPMEIAAIDETIHEAVIRGEVIALETREIISKKTEEPFTLVIFSVTDDTDTIQAKLFLSPEDWSGEDGLAKDLQVGSFLSLWGRVDYDGYSREIGISHILGIRRSTDFRRQRTDDAEAKRVELHCHTKMSDMDGVAEVDALIRRAYAWGHPAIAITDHGGVQAFPDANKTLKNIDKEFRKAYEKEHPEAKEEELARIEAPFKVIYGMEAYLVDDRKVIAVNSRGQTFADPFVVFDIETTGLSNRNCKIIEIGAVRIEGGGITDRFSTFVDPEMPIPFRIEKLTGISDQQVIGAPKIREVLPEFLAFCSDAVMVAHNADFDMGFLRKECEEGGFPCPATYVDTVAMARLLLPGISRFQLQQVAKAVGVPLHNHHRAVDDAECTAEIFRKFIGLLGEQEITDLDELNRAAAMSPHTIRKLPAHHAILLATSEEGRVNLYRCVSESHLNYVYTAGGAPRPKLPKSFLDAHREGLLVGSACEAGELYRALLRGESDAEIARIVGFYDYLEIQPVGNNEFLIAKEDEDRVSDVKDLQDLNREIVRLGEQLDKPVVATGDVHFLDPQDELYRRIIQAGKKFKDADAQGPLYLHTTEEMLEEFAYLGGDKAREVVIDAPCRIAERCARISPIRSGKFPPVIENSAEDLRASCYRRAHAMYGEVLPEIVEKRLERELTSIIDNGYAVMYIIAQKLVTKSNEDGYLVGSRGSVGSSFVATMAGITEVNPLRPHYLCPHCHYTDFDSAEVRTAAKDGLAGVDMEERACPVCGTPLSRYGYNIPFETFLGFTGNKEPDIDLNFSGEYQARAHKYTEEIFGEGQTFRAGTIGTMAEKTAYGYVKNYFDERGISKRAAEIDRIVKGCVGVRRTTGQHPGGIVVLPFGEDINAFTPVQHPADDMNSDIVTTHFDYHSIEENLLKLDILGHDDPTMIRALETMTGTDARQIPLNEPQVMTLFSGTEALGIRPDDISGCPLGCLGVPEFGTDNVISMLVETKPRNFSDLIRISGLSHGTNVWHGNAQNLIRDGKCTLAEAICTRDDIMTYLISQELEPELAFSIMESVRRGRGLTPDWEEEMRVHNVPDWYIDSCKHIEYMFPKAHAVAYVTMAYRIAWYKIYHPLAYYAAYFSIRASAFDYELMCMGRERLEEHMRELRSRWEELTNREKETYRDMRLVQEMYARGFEFLPMDIYRAKAHYFSIIDGKLMPALDTVDGLDKAADALAQAAAEQRFLSKDDLRQRAKISKTVTETLDRLGIIREIPESDQISFFDLGGGA